MGREIKFRAKPRDLAYEQFPDLYQKKDKSFVYGTGVYRDTHNTWLILVNQEKKPFSQILAKIVDPETVGQYTGLKDRNGKEIYEHDLFKYENDTGVIRYRDCGFYVDWLPPVTFGLSGNLSYVHSDGESIGNIYERPELLEAK